MKFYGEMRVQGSGPLDGDRFDALAYALAEIEQTDPAVAEVDLTASLAQGWVTASMIIDQENLERAVAKLIATVRTAIYPNGDIAGSWKFLAETADLSIRPAADRRAPGDQRPVSAAPASGGLPLRGGEPGAAGCPPAEANPAAGCPSAEASPRAACPSAEASPCGCPSAGRARWRPSGRGRAPAGDPCRRPVASRPKPTGAGFGPTGACPGLVAATSRLPGGDRRPETPWPGRPGLQELRTERPPPERPPPEETRRQTSLLGRTSRPARSGCPRPTACRHPTTHPQAPDPAPAGT